MPYGNDVRTKTTIRINKEFLTKAQQYGLNLSKTVENLLSFYLEGIEQLQKQIKQQNSSKKCFLLEKVLFWQKRRFCGGVAGI